MRFVLATAGLPAYGNHGGAQTCMGIVAAMRAAGHDVSVVSLFDQSPGNPYRDRRSDNECALRELGATVSFVDHDYDQLVNAAKLAGSGTLEHHYPWTRLGAETGAAISAVNPDAVFCYHFEPLAATFTVVNVPKVGGIGDPTHTPAAAQVHVMPKWPLGRYLMACRGLVKARRRLFPLMRSVLADCAVQGAFAGHYADWLHSQRFGAARYFRTPIADPLGGRDWQAERNRRREPLRKPRILLMGDVTGTATRVGLALFARRVLPGLIRALGEDRFEVRIVGRGTLPNDLQPLLNRSCVNLCGRIDPPDDEFLSADLLLVPTPVDLGIRVRILSAFSFACPVVAHTANTAGIPELQDGENCLLARTGRGLNRAVLKVLRDPALSSRLSRGGRKTYEECFSLASAGQAIVKEMEHLATETNKVRGAAADRPASGL